MKYNYVRPTELPQVTEECSAETFLHLLGKSPFAFHLDDGMEHWHYDDRLQVTDKERQYIANNAAKAIELIGIKHAWTCLDCGYTEAEDEQRQFKAFLHNTVSKWDGDRKDIIEEWIKDSSAWITDALVAIAANHGYHGLDVD